MGNRTFNLALCSAFLSATSALAGDWPQPGALPSGLQPQLLDQFVEPQHDGSHWARFRFVLPALAEGADYFAVAEDFEPLCGDYALPMLRDHGQSVSQVVISLSSQPVDFGTIDPDVIQFFEAFRVSEGRCIWEDF